ncbi:hypothetical protein QCA50_011312 [Cerrena zonata]|uniref:Lipid droplet-associated perilipin protein n=1 Tax=Cerrena zonata TaxID=2478898 RepID=A0AAW0G547_9APHY
MSTETETQQPPAAEITIIQRVTSIPIIASSIGAVDSTLSSNTYTQSSYAYAKGLSQTALSYAAPLQKTLSPILSRADEYANKGLDVVESRYPYPFKTPTEDIVKDLKGRSDAAKEVANKTLDEKVRSPAYNVAQGIDQKFAPIVDYFEVAVNKLHSASGSPAESPTSERPKYQYQRAVALSKDLTADIVNYSTEQVNQLKAQNALLHKAAETAEKVRTLASTSYGAAQEKVQALSDVMLQELHKVQASTANLPTAVQTSFQDISAGLNKTITDLSAILTSSEPIPDKVHRVRDTVQERVEPLLAASAARVQEILNTVLGKSAADKPTEETTEPTQSTESNGHA